MGEHARNATSIVPTVLMHLGLLEMVLFRLQKASGFQPQCRQILIAVLTDPQYNTLLAGSDRPQRGVSAPLHLKTT